MSIYGESAWDPMNIDVNEQFESYLGKCFVAKYESEWDGLENKHGFQGADTGLDIKNSILNKARKNIPFSVVRLNDGEGTVVFNEVENSCPELKLYLTERISQIIFGDKKVVSNDLESFLNIMKDSVASADIIGMPERSFARRRLLETAKREVDVRAVIGSASQIEYLSHLSKNNILKSNQKVASAWLSKYLLAHYQDITKHFDNVAIITGNKGLGNLMASKFDLPTVNEILIPTQRSISNGDAGKRHWPERYEEVISELSLLPKSTLVFVGAGLLGKSYCSHAKRIGLSAIDVGHVADIWYGKSTRPGVKDELVERWKF
jgi:hypothetical protein